jgi:hypothetical protein
MGCAHSKGALGCCYSEGYGVAADHAKAYALGSESAAAGSCSGQHVVAAAFYYGGGVAQDYAEAVRWYPPASSFAFFLFHLHHGTGQVLLDGYAIKKSKR